MKIVNHCSSSGRTTPDEAGATQRDGGTRDAEICKRRSGFPTTPGLTRPVGIMDRMDFFDQIDEFKRKLAKYRDCEPMYSKLINILHLVN